MLLFTHGIDRGIGCSNYIQKTKNKGMLKMNKNEIQKEINDKQEKIKNIDELKQNIFFMKNFDSSENLQSEYKNLIERKRELKMEIMRLKWML